MILFVTSHSQAAECLAKMREATNEEIVLAQDLRKAVTLLRTESYLAVVLDQFLLETEPDEVEPLMQHLGTAIPVQVNLAISGLERLVREVRFALLRRLREEQAVRRAVVSSLHSELNETVTALLLSCELALDTPGLPSPASEKLRSAYGLVKKLRSQLQAEGASRN